LNSCQHDVLVCTEALANIKLQSDKDVVLAAMENDGYFLQYVDKRLRADKDVVLTAVRSHAAALKYALGGLHQDEDCLIAAGKMISDAQSLVGPARCQNKKVVLSLKFTRGMLSEKNTAYATDFVQAMREDGYFMYFDTYNPNSWEKESCDYLFADSAQVLCRGTDETCRFQVSKNRRSSGRPSPTCCWRFSFRFHADEAAAANGFMVQVQEQEGLSLSQQMESDMAAQARLKVFRTVTNSASFHPELLRLLHGQVQTWYEAGCPSPEAATEVLFGDGVMD